MPDGPAQVAFDCLLDLVQEINKLTETGCDATLQRRAMDAARGLLGYISKERNGDL
jgi:hypothetical protein